MKGFDPVFILVTIHARQILEKNREERLSDRSV
jgi:hypothetical protein